MLTDILLALGVIVLVVVSTILLIRYRIVPKMERDEQVNRDYWEEQERQNPRR